MAVGTLASRLTGFARLFALAYALGLNSLADAYNLANTTPNIVYDLILGGILSATLVPVFVDRLATRTSDEAWDSISAVVTLAVVILLVATVVFVVAAPGFIDLYTVGNHGASAAEQRAVATDLLRLFAPQVALYGLVALITALLNAKRRFAAPTFVPILNNLVTIAVLLEVARVTRHPTLSSVHHDHGLFLLLGLGTTAGVAVQALALLPALRGIGAQLSWRWDPANQAVRTMLRLSGWTFGFVVANQVALFIVLALADGLGGGSVTAYSYAYAFFQLPYGIVAVSIMSAVQPGLAERWSLSDANGFRRRLAAGLRATMSVMVPAAVGLLVLARSVVAVVVGHGAAGTAGVHATARTLAFFAIGLPGFSAYLFMMRAYQAMQDTRSAFVLYIIENGLNVALAFPLSRSSLGVGGLALALSIAYTLAALVALADLRRRTVGVEGAALVRTLLRTGWISAIMAGVVALVAALVGSDHGVGLLVRVTVSVVIGAAVVMVAAGLAGGRSDARSLHRHRT
ncbi:MAG: murein biosynthesis integral membrane protein MurJ [Acidimicrobiales bacterium]|nr:MAG: murein biosynthesis integral membrane protein MurJ [Acidimicrobiales bacterium]